MNKITAATVIASAVAAVILLAASPARADDIEDYVHAEVGIGASHITDMGDGTWIQEGARSNHEEKNTPAFMIGLMGPVFARGNWDVQWNLDYVYVGTYTASVEGVPDNQYNAQTHRIVGYQGERFSPFNGQGHTQGVPFTLDVGYTWHGWRVGLEGGVWAYDQTWHDSLYTLSNQWVHYARSPKIQFGYVAGVNIQKGPFELSARRYQIKQDWSTGTPGLATSANVLMMSYRF